MKPPMGDDGAWDTVERNLLVKETGIVHLTSHSFRLFCDRSMAGLLCAADAEETSEPVTCIGCHVLSGFERFGS